jgi:UDP-2,3-diacylglucosamine pyrophosphatase LpxH
MIYLTGDTHGFYDSNFRFFDTIDSILNEDDILIVLGDFGYVWEKVDLKVYNTLEYYTMNCYMLNWMSKRKYRILFIDGNHENFDLLD